MSQFCPKQMIKSLPSHECIYINMFPDITPVLNVRIIAKVVTLKASGSVWFSHVLLWLRALVHLEAGCKHMYSGENHQHTAE